MVICLGKKAACEELALILVEGLLAWTDNGRILFNVSRRVNNTITRVVS